MGRPRIVGIILNERYLRLDRYGNAAETGGSGMDRKLPPIIAVDFDGTLSLGEWPGVGPPNIAIIRQLQERKGAGSKIILWTCRSGEALSNALDWCRLMGIEFDAVNENLPEVLAAWGNKDTRKIFADEYWDDKAVGLEALI